jgi:serine/threonine protein kinase
MAPEMITNKPHNHQIDVWSLGILLYELVHGRAPFRGSQYEIGNEIVKGTVQFKKEVSKDYKDLVMKILVQNPEERIPLVKVFVHPWVLFFQEKYQIKRERDSSSEETSSEGNQSEEDDESSYSEEEVKAPVRQTDKGQRQSHLYQT